MTDVIDILDTSEMDELAEMEQDAVVPLRPFIRPGPYKNRRRPPKPLLGKVHAHNRLDADRILDYIAAGVVHPRRRP